MVSSLDVPQTGRPPILTNPQRLQVLLDESTTQTLDDRRGNTPRSEYARFLLTGAINTEDLRAAVVSECLENRRIIKTLEKKIDNQTHTLEKNNLVIQGLKETVDGYGGRLLPVDSESKMLSLIAEKITVIQNTQGFKDEMNRGGVDRAWEKYGVGWLDMLNKCLTDYGFGKHKLTREDLRKRLFNDWNTKMS